MVNWEHPANNDFLLVSQFRVTGALSALLHSSFCLLPCPSLVVIELKQPGAPALLAKAPVNLQAGEAAYSWPKGRE